MTSIIYNDATKHSAKHFSGGKRVIFLDIQRMYNLEKTEGYIVIKPGLRSQTGDISHPAFPLA